MSRLDRTNPAESWERELGEERGSALAVTLLILFMLAGGALLALDLSRSGYKLSVSERRRVQAASVNEAGLELVRARFADIAEKQSSLRANPFVGYDGLHMTSVLGGVQPIMADVDLDGANEVVGEVVAGAYVLGGDPAAADARWVDPQGSASHLGAWPSVYDTTSLPTAPASQGLDERQIVIFVTAAVPSFADPNRALVSKEICYSVSLDASEVFDNAYFMHNWGWMGGTSDWNFKGNVRSNANFSWLGGCNMYGQGRYTDAGGGDLLDLNRQDDGGDGDNTNDGGTYAYGQVVGTTAGGSPADRYDSDNVDISANQHHPYQVELPNVNEQSYYDALADEHTRKFDDNGDPLAVAGGTGSRVGVYDPSDPSADAKGYRWYEKVVGDSGKQNLVLVGDSAHPIIIDGPVVVRGSLMIRGEVKGQGGIYAQEHVYVAGDLTYTDALTSDRPASNSTADLNAWRSANKDKGALGLFAAGSIFFGRGSGPTSYFNDASNDNTEASAGLDQTNNTSDDAEGAGVTEWEVEHYTLADAVLLNPSDDPAGIQEGDPIPGSGEDVDGDGQNDARSAVADFALPGVTTPPTGFGTADGEFGGQQVLDAEWEGVSRLGQGSDPYYRDAAQDANLVHGAFYSNHYLAGSLASTEGTKVNGSLVGRNEAFWASSAFDVNHDVRMIGGGRDYGFYLPRSWQPVSVIYTRSLTVE